MLFVIILICLVNFGSVFSEDSLILSVSLLDKEDYIPFPDKYRYNIVNETYDPIYFKCSLNESKYDKFYWQDNFRVESTKYQTNMTKLITHPGPDIDDVQLSVTCVASESNISMTIIIDRRPVNYKTYEERYENQDLIETPENCKRVTYPNKKDPNNPILLCIGYSCNNDHVCRRVVKYYPNKKDNNNNSMTFIISSVAVATALAAVAVVFLLYRKKQKALNARVVYCEIATPATSKPPPHVEMTPYATIVGVLEPKNKNSLEQTNCTVKN